MQTLYAKQREERNSIR